MHQVLLTLFGRRDCHLCESMAQELRRLGMPFVESDVDAVPELEDRYGDRVPVLVREDGSEVCHGRLDAAALRIALGTGTA